MGICDGECRAGSCAGAVGGEAAAVLLEDRAADGEAQSQPAEAPGGGDPPLLQDVKDARQDVGLDTDAGVAGSR